MHGNVSKGGCVFFAIAVPLVCKYVLLLNWKSLRSNVSSSRVRINLSGLFFVFRECLFDGGNALLNRYVGVKRLDIEREKNIGISDVEIGKKTLKI